MRLLFPRTSFNSARDDRSTGTKRMSVVSSTDVECFRRLTNPEVVDVNGAGTSTRQIAQQMRQAMEQVVAAQHSEELSKQKDESSEDESSEKSKSKAPAGAASRLARAMHALQNAPERPAPPPPPPAEVRPPAAAQSSSSGLNASTPSSLPVTPQRVVAPPESRSEARPPSVAAPQEEDKASSSEDEDDASTTCAKKDPETVRLEKQGYLIELQALRSKGVKLSREFSMKDTLTELEFEVQKQNSNLNAAAAVSNMKDMMRIGFNGLEMANARFGPFLCMDGWAESLTSDMKRFDNALEKLYKRYWRKQSMSPVMELGMIILGSLAMHHFKSKLFGPVRPPPKAATAAAPQPESVSPPPPRLRRGGTPAQTPVANQREPSRPALRPTLKPPTAMFGF
jgi:Family of unknown function (DUF5767)